MGERRGRRMRGLAVVGALTAATLSGCSLIGDGQQVWDIMQQDAAKQEVLAAALGELRELDGVDKATSRFLPDGPHGDEADINVVATAGAAAEEVRAITSVVRDAFTSAELNHAIPLFTLQIGDGGTLTQTTFAITENQFATEVAYWRAVEGTIGAPVSLKLVETGDESSYLREFLPAVGSNALHATGQLIANYAELQSLPDPSAATAWWIFPGLIARPALPPAELIALLDRLSAVMPLQDFSAVPADPPSDYEYPEGATVQWGQWWPDGPVVVWVSLLQNELRSSDWPTALQAAALTAAVPGASFVYQAGDGSGETGEFRFHTAACNGVIDASEDDRRLVDALAQRGTFLPADGGPGTCSPVPEE